MIRLVFLDLRDHAAIWAGAFVIAVACGYIGGWAVSIEATAATYASLRSFSLAVVVFSSLAAFPVLSSAAKLTVSAQRRSYALWQLANMKPWLVGVVVLSQLALVAMLGAVCGTLLEACTCPPLFPWVFSSYDPPADVRISLGEAMIPVVWLIVAGVFVVGGARGALSAGRTSPLAILRESEPKHVGMTLSRILLFAGLAGTACALAYYMIGSGSDVGVQFSLYMPVLAAAMMAPLAPLVCPVLLKAWTSLVSRERWNAWFLARHVASHSLSASVSVETSIMVGFGLIAGIFSLSAALGLYVLQRNMSGYSTALDWTSSVLLLGGPVLLCAIGAAVSVVMSSRSRVRDVALLVVCGARRSTLVVAAVCEAFIHAVTATLVGALGAVFSQAAVTSALELPFLAGLGFLEGSIVSLMGFVLVLAATLIPTLAALRKDVAVILAGS